MNKYELTTLKKKKTIIDASLSLFKDNGFTNVSIKEIAAKSSVSQVSIYNYFGSKDSLVYECSKVIMEDTLLEARNILDMDIPFQDKLEKALSTCSKTINISLSQYLTETALNDSAFMELLKVGINEGKTAIYKDYIELGKKENVIDNNIDTDTILIFMNSLNNTSHIFKSTKEINDLHQLFLFGILGKK